MNAAEEAELLTLYRRAKEVDPEGARRVLMIAEMLADGTARAGTAIGAVIDHVLGVAPVAWSADGPGLIATLGSAEPITITITPVTAEMRFPHEQVGDWRWSVDGTGAADADLGDAKTNAINTAIVVAYQSANLTPIEGASP